MTHCTNISVQASVIQKGWDLVGDRNANSTCPREGFVTHMCCLHILLSFKCMTWMFVPFFKVYVNSFFFTLIQVKTWQIAGMKKWSSTTSAVQDLPLALVRFPHLPIFSRLVRRLHFCLLVDSRFHRMSHRPRHEAGCCYACAEACDRLSRWPAKGKLEGLHSPVCLS